MGCGHSKTNIQNKKDKNKTNLKKEELFQRKDSDADSVDSDAEEVDEKAYEMKTINTKSNEIPLTLAQRKLSCSQQNFFKMLDERIENGHDYDDTNTFEVATENARLASLLKDWETASAGSRSLEGTPKKHTFQTQPNLKNAIMSKYVEKRSSSMRQSTTPIPQSIIHQSYGVTPMQSGREGSNVTYVQDRNSTIASSSSYQTYNDYSYQAFSPMCTTDQYNNSPSSTNHNTDNQVTRYVKPSSKQISVVYDNNNCRSPPISHKSRKNYSNGDLLQQQIQIEQVQYRQAKELAHYKMMKEQHLLQQQHNYIVRNYQSSVQIPMGVTQTYKEAMNKNQIER